MPICVIDRSQSGLFEKSRMPIAQAANSVGACEAKTHLAELLEKVQAGEEITITRHGTPVAKLVPVKKRSSADERAAAVKRIQKLGRGLSLGDLTIKDLIKEDRK
jgi:prevent-host-death family protein